MDVDENSRIDMKFLYQLDSKGHLAVLQWCMEMRLITCRYVCPKCGKNMRLTERNCVIDGFSWVCRRGGKNYHHIKRSVRSFSWFNDRRLSIVNILLITYLWIKKTGPVFIRDELTIAIATTTDWFNVCRQVCVEICLLESDILGGEDMTVEICETRFTQGKNLAFKGESGKWLIIGIENDTKKFFFRVCKNKNKEALLDIIKNWVLPGSRIVSDIWKTFSCLNDKKFKQLKISQNLTFQNPPRKSQSENIFTIVKNLMRGSHANDVFILQLAEYMWRRSHNDNTRSLIKSFFKNLTRIYHPHHCDYMD